VNFSIKNVRQIFILNSEGNPILLEEHAGDTRRMSYFSELVDLGDANEASKRFFSVLANNSFIDFPMSADSFLRINKDDSIYQIYTKSKNKIFELFPDILRVDEYALDNSKRTMKKLYYALEAMIESKLGLEESLELRKEFLKEFYKTSFKTSSITESLVNRVVKEELRRVDKELAYYFKNEDIKIMLTGEKSTLISELDFDDSYFEILMNIGAYAKDESYYSVRSFNLNELKNISLFRAFRNIKKDKIETTIEKISTYGVYSRISSIPFSILRDLDYFQITSIIIRKNITYSASNLWIEIVRREHAEIFLNSISSSSYSHISDLGKFLVEKTSVWPVQMEKELSFLLKKFIENINPSFAKSFLDRVVNISKEIDSKFFVDDKMYLINLFKEEFQEFIIKTTERDCSFDYFSLYYRSDETVSSYENVLAPRDLAFLNSGEFMSDVSKLKIMLDVIFKNRGKTYLQNLSDDVVKEVIKNGIGVITGPAIASEKRRFIRIFASLLHQRNTLVDDRLIRLFFKGLSDSKIRRTVLEKLFSLPEIIEGNNFIIGSRNSGGIISSTVFFGKEYQDLMPLIDDLNIHSSIKSTILLLALQ
jgi:hypothetical protein